MVVVRVRTVIVESPAVDIFLFEMQAGLQIFRGAFFFFLWGRGQPFAQPGGVAVQRFRFGDPTAAVFSLPSVSAN